MQNALKKEIKRLCRRDSARKAMGEKKIREYQEKYEKRTGKVPGASTIPSSLSVPHKHFDPIFCARNANFLSKTIWHKVQLGKYQPKPAIRYSIRKPSGGFREIMAFTIPDAALANVVLRRTRERNLKKLSPFSYAYHPNLNVFDAILALDGFITDQRFFAVQIDFEKFFDSISTQYLECCINDHERISLTRHERAVLKAFMRHQFASKSSYRAGFFERRKKGTPQGASVSLLLANLANYDLDKALERRSGRFVRFADDVVALCSTYAEAEGIEATFIEHCRNSGLTINEKKSPGIAIIGKSDAEIRSYPDFDYLGYTFTRSGLKMPSRVRARIRAKLSRLIHIYLIHYPNKFGFNASRCSLAAPSYDWDLLGLILEIRRYLYGGLEEMEIGAFLDQDEKLRRMRGLMGFYALLNDRDGLRALDNWLLVNLSLAIKKRRRILLRKYGCLTVNPTFEELIVGTWFHEAAWSGVGCPDPRLPSFVRGWRAARKYYLRYGLKDVEAPEYLYYGSWASDSTA